MRITRRVVVGIWVLLLIFMSVLLLAYYSNKKMIKDFKKEKYEFNQLGFLGFTEPYVNPYNRGNIFYSLGDYNRAIAEYDLALSYDPPEPADCMIRVNYALSLIEPIDADNVTADNIDDVIEILDEARDILCENGCANDDGDGHYEPAQKLKDEIDEFEQELLEQVASPEETPTPTPTSDPSGGTTDTPTPTPDSGDPSGGAGGEMTPEEQIAALQQMGLEERVGGTEEDFWTSDWNWGDMAYW